MSKRLIVWLWLAALVPIAACGKSGGSLGTMPVTGGAGGSGAGAGGGSDAPEPSDAEWKALRALSPEALPGPLADISNKYADDEAAAALGQALFFDTGFSGQLLDADNDGGPNSLGTRGQAGRVSCAGCHMAQSVFADTRSTFQEISLATGWTHRRTPSLLDIGQAGIVMWAGALHALVATLRAIRESARDEQLALVRRTAHRDPICKCLRKGLWSGVTRSWPRPSASARSRPRPRAAS